MTALATNSTHRLTTAILVGLAFLIACATSKRTDLRVTSFSPNQHSGELETSIQIQFDRPAVNGGEVGMPLESAPVIIAPAVEVSAHWIDRQTLVGEHDHLAPFELKWLVRR